MMNFQSLLLILTLSQVISAAPIVITRQHTAEAVTVTETYTTETATHTAPTVEILVSDGVTYTFTLTDDAAYPQPTTFTSIINKDTNPTTQTSEDDTPATSAAAPTTTTLAPLPSSDSGNNDDNTATTTQDNVDDNTSSAQNDNDENTSSTQNDQASTTTTENNNGENTSTAQNDQTSTTAAQETTSTQPTTTHEAPAAYPSTYVTYSSTTTSSSTSSTSTSSTSTSTGSKLTSKPTAIVYSPYNNDNSCKDYDSVNTDLNYIKGLGIDKIRVYGTDCNSIENVEAVAKDIGLKINQGFWIGDQGVDSIDDGVDALITWGSANGWDVIDFITVGNEAVQFEYASVDDLLNKISEVKAKLQAAGYTGKVTTSEPPHIIVLNPTLCTSGAVDFIGINPHSYFDTYSTAASAGSFVKGQRDLVREACGDIDILITETGFPSAGIQNGGNIPSKANQLIAVQSILDELDNECTILSTFDDYWKEPGSYGIEQSFGIWDLLE